MQVNPVGVLCFYGISFFVGLYLFYWVIRKAVAAGILDADGQRRALDQTFEHPPQDELPPD